jgi:predicted transcriptional regulator
MFRISKSYLKGINPKNRSNLKIICDMLCVATERCRKTKIMYDAHLNFQILEKYLKNLLKSNLIKIVDDNYYLVTLKGKDFIKKYKNYVNRCNRIGKEIKYVHKEKKELMEMCFS